MDETTLNFAYEAPHLPSERMSLALDGLLDPGEQQEFDLHLSACDLCSDAWLRWRRVSNVLQIEPYVAPPPGFILRVDEAIRRDEKRRERMWGGVLLVGGTMSIWTLLLIGLGLVLALVTTAFPEVRLSLVEYFAYIGQTAALIVRNVAAIRDGLLAMMPGPAVTAAVAVALVVLTGIWLRLVRSTGRRSVASGQQAPTSNGF